MQERIEARAGLNGSGAGRELGLPTEVGTTGSEAGAAGNVAAPPERYPMVALMKDPALRAELKRRVTETADTYQEMGDWLGVSKSAVNSYVLRQAWPRPASARGRHATPAIEIVTLDQNAQLIRARLLQAIVRQVDKVDARLRKRDAEVDEKDSRVLANLAKTLGALMNTGSGGPTSKEMERPNRAEVEARLAERIRRWARGEEGSE